MTVKEIAEHFGVTKQTVYNWIKSGLKCGKEKVIGIKPRKIIEIKDVEKFLINSLKGE